MKSFKLVLAGMAILMCIILVSIKFNDCPKKGRPLIMRHDQREQLHNDSPDEIEVYPYSILVNIPY